MNTEMSLMRKAVLQNRVTLGIVTTLKGGICAIIQKECCMFILGESANVLSLLNHMRTQVNAMSNMIPRQGDLINQINGSDDGALGGKKYYLFWESLS